MDILHISEAPHFPDEARITEAEQMLRRTGIKITESTACGVGNLFEKRFMEAWKAKLAGKHHHRIALFFRGIRIRRTPSQSKTRRTSPRR